MNFEYSPFQRLVKSLYRKVNPVSPWTMGEVEDICKINLVPPERLVSFFENCIDVLMSIKGDDIGDYLEFGVFNGNSIGSMYLAKENKKVENLRLFGFDSFEGLPAGSENEDDSVWKTGFYSCSFEQTKECLARRKVKSDDIIWVDGWYDETLSEDSVKDFNIENIGIVFIDCDTYSSSKTVLDFLSSRIKKPVIICFDDWKLNDLDIKEMGEYKSFNEFLAENINLKAMSLKSYNRKSRTFLVQPR